MLYVFHGSDVSTAAKKAHALVDSLRAKKPDAAYVAINADHWSRAAIEENIGGQGLFSSKYIVLIDRVTENAEAKEQVGEFVPAMQESANIFILLEAKVNAELKKTLEKHAEKVVVSEPAFAKATVGKEEFNIFALADALGTRDAFKAWSIYRKAVDGGIESESILGTLFWQAKSMKLALEAKSAAESGLSPFVFSKSKRYAGNYSPNELNGLVRSITMLYHDGHRGMVDLELSVEQLLLNCGKSGL